IWQGAFTGWFSSFLFFGPLVYTPIANVAFWNVTHSLIGNSTFTDLGSAILVAVGGSNVIWGNAIVPAAQEPSFYIYPDELGIQVLESGDLIYNNWVTVNVPAYALNYNLYTGAPQVNDNDWNLSAPEPAVNVAMVNGFALTGSIVGSDVQCGNFWGNYLPLAPLPYNNSGLIGNAGDGDYCPYPIGTYPHGVPFFTVTFTETGLTSGNWSVTVGGMTKTADPGSAISFLLSNGIWPFSVASSDGLTPNPASGTLTLPGAGDVTVSFVAPLAAAEGGLPSPTDVNQPVSFTATPSGGSGTYTYAWGFGDGASSTDQNPTHTYTTNGTYNVTLSVNDSFGGSFSTWMNVTVNPLPEWTVSASVSSTDVGRPVDFRSTYANGTEPYTFSWDFGDGSVSSAQNPGHAYASPALYFVLFEITDAAGVSSSRVIPVLVNPVPQVTASASTTAPVTGQSVDFTGLVGGGTNPFNFTWTFGDGSTASAQNTSHAFGSAGTYKVTFRVIDRVGMPAATTFTLVVSESSVTTTTAVVGSAAALIIGIVATALVLTYLTRRRKKPNEPGPGSQGGSSSPPSP
ncbi:MAG TPA: PKD domain-containing protein, partial [Thermoplasmata archaeon]|nr:PKD domain-containing protein [Thermoplasmata archaeon]